MRIADIVIFLLIVALLFSNSLVRKELKRTKEYNKHLIQHLLECEYGFDSCKILYKNNSCQPPRRSDEN